MRTFTTPALCAGLALLIVSSPAAAQSARQPFTPEDMLKVASISVLDLSDDGRRVAATSRRPYDNPTTDHRRYGDPTYVSPSREALLVIDILTGATVRPLAGLVDVRRAAWSRDGNRLAILTVDPDADLPATRLHVWDASAGALREVPQRGGDRVSVNSGLDWTPDGGRLVVTLRTADQDRAAADRFRTLTDGPIVVHDSEDPFLEWDALRRADREREIAEIDVATGAKTTVLPMRKVTSYDVARDGSFLTVMQDVTAKTDYDVIGGTDNDLLYVAHDFSRARTTDFSRAPSAPAEPRLVVKAAELKGLRLRWSDDGRTFAYAKKGEVFVQRVDEEKPRSLTPRPAEETKEAAGEPAPGEDKPEPESFTPGPFSRDASKILVTSKKGWYVVDVASGARELVLPLDENEDRNPRLSAIDWSPDGRAIYVDDSARDRWARGVTRLDVATKTMTPVVRDARLYRNIEMARDGGRWVFTMSDGDGPFELYETFFDNGLHARAAFLANPERYLEHSAVLRADRIGTPLLNITGDQDPNVPASQSREIYYALRRLGKPVEWVRYVDGGHRPPNTIEESIDFENRILAWYDKYLKKDGKKTTSEH